MRKFDPDKTFPIGRRAPSEMSDRKVTALKENFALWVLAGMKNSTNKILRPVLGPRDISWFLSCIQYMIDRIKIEQDKRINK